MQRFENYVYKGSSTAAEFRDVLQQAARTIDARIIWEESSNAATCLNTSHEGDIHKVQLTGSSLRANGFYKEIGRITGFPWINFCIPGAPIWLYTLYLGDERKDHFNPCPEMWEDPDTISNADLAQLSEQWSGNPELLARLWNVTTASIERYIRPWGLTKSGPNKVGYKFKLSGKAYPHDKSQYGKGEQMLDFWRALGISNTASSQHTLVVGSR